METIVLDQSNNVVTNTVETNYVAHSSTSSAIIDNTSTVFVSLETTETVLVEVDKSQLVVTGLLGPVGKDGIAEDDIVYTKRIDFIDDSTLYRGEATPGSNEASSVWRIRKTIIAVDGDVSETWASGSAEFNKAWSNRLGYLYS